MTVSLNYVMKGVFPVVMAFAVAGCSEDEEGNGAALINTSIELSSTAALSGRLIINSAYLNIQQLDLSAVSLSKNTVRVNTEFVGEEQTFSLTGRSLSPAIPIETKSDRYDPLSIRITTAADEHKLQFITADGTTAPDYDDFQNNAKPALLVTGLYESRGASIPFILAVSEITPLQTIATQNGDPTVEIGLENLAEIKMNPAVWFEEITPQLMDDADRIQSGNRQMIFIHQDFNSDLYEKILLKLETPEKSMSFNLTVTRQE